MHSISIEKDFVYQVQMMVRKRHDMHPHELVLNRNTNDYNYLCNGCQTHGFGKTFRCHQCNFDMHEFCIDCPRQLESFLHPQNNLNRFHPQHHLDLRGPDSQSSPSLKTCNVCGDSVKGLHYCCQRCNFNVHPLCTQFPQFLYHKAHDVHKLTFQKPDVNAACCGCEHECDSWRYRCEECDGFDFHVDCLTKPDATMSTITPPPFDSSSKGSTSRSLPPSAGTYTYPGYQPTNPTFASHPYPHNTFGSHAYSHHYDPNNCYHYNMQNPHNHFFSPPIWGKIGATVFDVLIKLGVAVLSNVITGDNFLNQ